MRLGPRNLQQSAPIGNPLLLLTGLSALNIRRVEHRQCCYVKSSANQQITKSWMIKIIQHAADLNFTILLNQLLHLRRCRADCRPTHAGRMTQKYRLALSKAREMRGSSLINVGSMEVDLTVTLPFSAGGLRGTRTDSR